MATSPAPIRTTTRTAARSRATRFASGTASRSTSRTHGSVEAFRPPLILEISAKVIRAGFADNPLPWQLIPLPNDFWQKTLEASDEAQAFCLWSPWIDRVYDRLLITPSSRKVMIVHPTLYLPTMFQTALQQLLWNKSVPALTIVSSLEIGNLALGWKRGLIVQIQADEATCVCHCDGHMLPWSFQSVVECGYTKLLNDPQKLQTEWTAHMDYHLLDHVHNPNSLVVAILKSLEACPRDLRMQVIHHLQFCGEGMLIFPDLGRRVAQRLEQILEGQEVEASPLEESSSEEKKSTDQPMQMALPVNLQTLRPLASQLRLISCQPHRPDFLAYTSACLYASTWNRYEEAGRIEWKVNPSEQA
eukprot:CAMPEP_0176135414 /NCGR_PEP_ID=MMETSP0120_2-20121206/68695_1 /TAXON_ID=160619 /ORGANISM="Kryptoperidinium foliaceum, Strain CCMP 1326" /LENGTH=359 /DNA_ID=CAMNT_0017471123 /DNA_START=134 /DNA_END=1213 /DNA_ORIENTATION=+